MFAKVYTLFRPLLRTFDFLMPVGDLAVRLWVAHIFFKAALTKIQSWDSTILLFTHEYQVPFLSPVFAAYLGTGAELILPILLVLGLGGRVVIFVFFCYNAIAVISYPYLHTPEGLPGLLQHVNWGLLLMMLMFHGSGKISLDHWLAKHFERKLFS
ncbi:DoxX [Piscirickettsia salmonis]|uniref:DoxX n=2 Tax=Piscirickettsia salmonis TaxID=1238 RepID=A0A1L6TH31_PISSA|nr:DoxX family protein [Piscirickettsia salmonis]AKP73051.1 hypothetical protein PSLF89_1007 [Piscirickettsia salmonis LF-89 = ATCC VR-1361]OAJ33651.1 DoxX [Piscirickettsiaceae bacterium NZ-RLO1]ALB21691.1 doxX [Piscirickettsia salmonis]ALY01889.1 hypothetical protein AWE47_02560 [Piscirickettsia salmonis]AMA41398.1 hypothetical protein AWJ11_02545 [Piscirickettsia salmonis]